LIVHLNLTEKPWLAERRVTTSEAINHLLQIYIDIKAEGSK
jgi:hypothetical protein